MIHVFRQSATFEKMKIFVFLLVRDTSWRWNLADKLLAEITNLFRSNTELFCFVLYWTFAKFQQRAVYSPCSSMSDVCRPPLPPEATQHHQPEQLENIRHSGCLSSRTSNRSFLCAVQQPCPGSVVDLLRYPGGGRSACSRPQYFVASRAWIP